MEYLMLLGIVVGVVFAILQIILFFKLWGMTEDIKMIREKFMKTSTTQNLGSIQKLISVQNQIPPELKTEVMVVNIKTGVQMRRKEFNSETGKYKCYTDGGTVFVGEFHENEIYPIEF